MVARVMAARVQSSIVFRAMQYTRILCQLRQNACSSQQCFGVLHGAEHDGLSRVDGVMREFSRF
jgi:hypothetical protein